MMAGVQPILVEIVEIDPANVSTLVIADGLRSLRGEDHEPHVVMEHLGLARTRNIVDVEIDSRIDDLESLDARLLCSLLECHARQVRFPVGVPTRLKPTAELRVEHQQRLRRIVIEDQCRACQMARRRGSIEGVGLQSREFEESTFDVLERIDVYRGNVMPRSARF